MKKQPSSAKTYLALVAIVVIAALVYFYIQGKDPSTNASIEEANMQDEAVGARVLALLNQINMLRIDTDLFSDPIYSTLRDYTVQVQPLPVGRVNPFSPIPGAPSPFAPAAGTPKR